MVDLDDPFKRYYDTEFQSRFRFTKAAVHQLFDVIRSDSELQQRKQAVPGLLQLVMALRFYATGHFQRTDGDLLGTSRQTAGEIIHRISRCIARAKKSFLAFPENLGAVKSDFYKIGKFPSVIGCIDCTHIPIVSPGGDSAEVFRNRKGYFSINVQAVCDANRCFTNIVARWPGSTHDSRIFDNSVLRDELEAGKHDGILLGDSGYPLRKYLLVPVSKPATASEHRYNTAQFKTRTRIEQAFGLLKQRFRVLRIPLRTKLDNSIVIIVAAFCLHNFAIRTRQSLTATDDALDAEQELVEMNASTPQSESSATASGRGVRRQIISGFFSSTNPTVLE